MHCLWQQARVFCRQAQLAALPLVTSGKFDWLWLESLDQTASHDRHGMWSCGQLRGAHLSTTSAFWARCFKNKIKEDVDVEFDETTEQMLIG